MSWMEKLYQTYESNKKQNIANPSDKIPLLPIAHTIQNAHVEIAIDASGNFMRAKIIEKIDSPTIVPCTEDAAGRAGITPKNYALFDKLQYIAGDFIEFGGTVTSGFSKNPREPYESFLKQLSSWCNSPFRHTKVCAVMSYLGRGNTIADLVKIGILPVDHNGKLLKNTPKRGAHEIFGVIASSSGPEDAFVRFSVEIPGEPQADLWTDKTVWKSWIDFYESQESKKGLCYVTGEEKSMAVNHPKRIRHPADGAKLISSNDTSGFTFRGRFTTSDEACGVSFEVTQKAHSALRWLIARQGRRDGNQAIVAWAVSGADIPDPFSDTASLLKGTVDGLVSNHYAYTAQEFGIQLSKLIAGYSMDLGPTNDIVVMALDSASTGRIAIRYHRELTGSEFLRRVQYWHSECSWWQNYGKDKKFIGAPAPRDIAEAAFGRRLDENLRKATTERLLPCIIEATPIPRDLVELCVRRACQRAGLEKWEWEKALGIACALIKYQNKERRYSMALERDRKTRDYLYGRLLALAEYLEGRALYVAGETRPTNAERLMQRFADHPHSTWLTIETALTPYRIRLKAKRPGSLLKIDKEIDEVFESFIPEEFLSDQRLSGEFLLSYHCQRSALWPANQPEVEESSNDQANGLND